MTIRIGITKRASTKLTIMFQKNILGPMLKHNLPKIRVIIMSLFSKSKKVERVESTAFSEFIRNAPSKEKKRVYSEVLKKATEMQNDVLNRAQSSTK